MAVFEVPLSATPQTVTVPVLSTAYQFTLLYRGTDDGGWVLDIADLSGVPLLSGMPLVTGADLLAQHGHLGLGFELRVSTDGAPDAIPDFADLGAPSRLYIITP